MAKTLTRWDPVRTMARWDPFQELRDMRFDMDRLFDRFFGRDVSEGKAGTGELMPPIESYVKGNEIVIKCELPGVDPKDVDLSFDMNTHELIIKGERTREKEAKEEDYIHSELAYGYFERRFTLPEGIKTDELKAKYTNGILEITTPLAAAMKPKKIEIETPTMIEEEGKVKKAA